MHPPMMHLSNIFTYTQLMALELYNKRRSACSIGTTTGTVDLSSLHTIMYRCLGLRRAEIFSRILDKDCVGQTDQY